MSEININNLAKKVKAIFDDDEDACIITKLSSYKSLIITASSNSSGFFITLEEHTIVGGLFSKISQICINNKFMPKSIISFGIPDTFPKVVGSQSYLRTYYGIDSNSLIQKILKL